MTTLDILIKARKLLSDPRRWRKGAYIQPDAEVDGGFCYCAVGALEAASGVYVLNPDTGKYAWNDGLTDDAHRVKLAANSALREHVPPVTDEWGTTYNPSVESYNDQPSTTYEDVLQLFSDAIQAEIAEAQELVAA